MSPDAAPPDTLITCHSNADFDAAAALVGASLLYPGAALVFPGTQERQLHKFYEETLRWLYDFRSLKDIDFARVRRLVVVDTRQADRVPLVADLLRLPNLEIHVWDHHRDQDGLLPAVFSRVEETGSTSTLLTEEIRNRGLRPRCEDATILGLGIYGDTGSFSFPSTTARDFAAASWLLDHGMDVAAIAGQMRSDMTREQLRALNDLLESAETHDLGGISLTLAVTHFDNYFRDFATLAPRFMEIQPCHIFFALGAMEDKIQVVARSQPGSPDVGAVCSLLGGGGHRYAASATVRDRTVPELRDFILTRLSIMLHPGKTAGQLMSTPVVGLEESGTLREAEAVMNRYGFKAMPVFRPGSRVCTGWLEHQLALKAISHGLGDVPAAAYMQRNFQVVGRNADLQTLMNIIVGARQRLVPVVDGPPDCPAPPARQGNPDPEDRDGELKSRPVAGIVTRTDIINLFMDEETRLPQPRRRARRERDLSRLMRARISAPGMDMLERAGRLGSRMGAHVYAVGGFVRDLLMDWRGGRWPDMDIDLVAEGDGIAFAHALSADLGGRVREHREFMTAVVLFPSSSLKKGGNANRDAASPRGRGGREWRVDVATARLEYYASPAALPTVELSSIKMDLYRRDFTINAMAVQLNPESFGLLVDFFDGQSDIRQKRIRILHALSFVEDPTRALRAVRFEQRFQFRIGAQDDRLIRNTLDLRFMDKLSGTRILNELELMLREKNPLACFLRMQEFAMLAAIHPQFDFPPWKAELLEKIFRSLDWHRHLYLPEQPDPLFLFLLAICRNAPPRELRDVLERLALPANRRENLLAARAAIMDAAPKMEEWHERNGPVSELHDILRHTPPEGLLYLLARLEQGDMHKKLSHYVYQGRMEKADINGKDLRAMGLEPGPLYGRILQKALAAKLDGFAPTRAAQLDLAAGMMEGASPPQTPPAGA